MTRTHVTTRLRSAAVVAAALSVLAAALLGGCAERQRIIEQTVGAKAQDVASEAESSHVPDELLTWEMVQEVDPGFEEARGVAFGPNDALYIAGDEAVRKVTAEGQVEWEMAVGDEPSCLTLDREGAIVVGLRGGVEVYDQSGRLQDAFTSEDRRTWITSLAATPGGIYVADAGNRRVLRYDGNARVSVFVTKDEARGIPALSIPSPHLDIVAAADPASDGSPDTLVVVNPGRGSIQYHSLQDGSLLRSWQKRGNDTEGFGGCCNPTDIALLPDGRVVTSEKGIPRVKVYSDDGELLSVVMPPDAFQRGTSGIDLATDSSGRVAVLDPERGVVRLYEEKGGEQGTVSE